MRRGVFSPIIITASLLIVLFSGNGFADPVCEEGYRDDSFGRGIEAGFKGVADLRPKLVDEGCYQLGVRKGVSLHDESQIADCEGDFEEGIENGFKVTASSAGTACLSGGYRAGLAKRRVGARERDVFLVGMSCVEEFNRGYNDGKDGNVRMIPGREPEDTCYNSGYLDGRMFR